MIVRLIFSLLSLSDQIMARNPRDDGEATPDLSWVRKETLETVSLYSADGAAKTPRCWIGWREDWEMSPLTTSDRIVRAIKRIIFLCMKRFSGRYVFDFPSLRSM